LWISLLWGGYLDAIKTGGGRTGPVAGVLSEASSAEENIKVGLIPGNNLRHKKGL
jgi:hypothetical protein